jgi:hypothetical protein
MKLAYYPIRLEDQRAYSQIADSCPELTSDYSFANLWGWADEYKLEFAWTEELVWIRQQLPHECHWAPIGAWDEIEKSVWLDCCRGDALTFTRVPQSLVQVWHNIFPGRLIVENIREHWDYIYSASDLKSLTGNRYHKKKNLLNQFKKKYSFEYQFMDENRIKAVLDMQNAWCTFRDCESHATLAAENRVIARILGNWGHLENLMGGCLMVDDQMAAYTVGEPLTNDTLMIHFEKGDPAYRGIYQAINQMFIEHAGDGFAKINREQDLGDEGLRKAKLSYHPIELKKKFAVTLGRE